MTKFKTVNRKAEVGEQILITNAEFTNGRYRNGDVLTVRKRRIGGIYDGVYAKELDIHAAYIDDDEYRVIIENKPSDNARLTEAEAKIAALEAEVATLKKAVLPEVTYQIDSRALGVILGRISPNQRRDDVIKRAQAFVTDLEKRYKHSGITFHVNPEKGVVTALAISNYGGKVISKAFAKCDPNDVFNATIGKAIAVGRLYGVDIPKEFTDAPKPTEVVVGMHVKSGNRPVKVYAVKPERRSYNGDNDAFIYADRGFMHIKNNYEWWTFLDDVVILDDTDAVYV